MAVSYYPETFSLLLWDWGSAEAATGYPEVAQSDFNPYQFGEKAAGRYINKVWDPVVNGWVRWTTDHIDFQGLEYPYPANWGVVLQYAVERLIMENL